jgi:hypothetical protein
MAPMSMDSMPIESAREGSTCASRPAGRPSQQIWIENGQPLAGMNPGGMSARDANATSMRLAMSVRLFRLAGLKRISQSVILGGEFYQQKRNSVAVYTRGPTSRSILKITHMLRGRHGL